MKYDVEMINDAYWCHAICDRTDYPARGVDSGKWLIFVPVDKANQWFTRITGALAAGNLGHRIKIYRQTKAPSERSR